MGQGYWGSEGVKRWEQMRNVYIWNRGEGIRGEGLRER